MKEYIQIQTEDSPLILKGFRIAYGTIMPINGIFRLDIGFVNPYASGFSFDVFSCWAILLIWVIYESP